MVRACLASLLLLGLGCTGAADPPGRTSKGSETETVLVIPTATAAAGPSDAKSDGLDPTEPTDEQRIASIAMRTWVYDRPAKKATKLGYLRAGAVVARGRTSAGTDGCDEGWYRVRPRGYVCVGKGATLDLSHPVVLAATRGPDREAVTPYEYVISRHPPPHLYFVLPTEKQQLRAEGDRAMSLSAARTLKLIGEGDADPVPDFLANGGTLPKPYGAKKNLHYEVHAGKANENSAFGLITAFDWTDRRFGLTTELDLIPLDRTKPAIISKLKGVEIKHGGVPAFVTGGGTPKYEQREQQFVKVGVAEGRTAWELTGKNNGSESGLWETTEGVWLSKQGFQFAELREDRAGFARKGRKWISVSIKHQILVAYEGTEPVYAALVSTGRGGMSDPEETHATVRGTFMIHAKHVSGLMDGDEASDESFVLHDVPYIQYFHEGYALHGAYWHDEFGQTRSHGCVNLPPADAAWLFNWTDPVVPPNWHGAVNLEAGTLVQVHY